MKIKVILTVVALAGVVFWLNAILPAIAAPAERPSATETTRPKARFTQAGLASFYSPQRRAASGGGVHARTMTAAHLRLPFGSRVRVTHLKSGKEVTVTVTDRGPFRKDRIIDVSREAADALGMTKQGVARVRITLVE